MRIRRAPRSSRFRPPAVRRAEAANDLLAASGRQVLAPVPRRRQRCRPAADSHAARDAHAGRARTIRSRRRTAGPRGRSRSADQGDARPHLAGVRGHAGRRHDHDRDPRDRQCAGPASCVCRSPTPARRSTRPFASASSSRLPCRRDDDPDSCCPWRTASSRSVADRFRWRVTGLGDRPSRWPCRRSRAPVAPQPHVPERSREASAPRLTAGLKAGGSYSTSRRCFLRDRLRASACLARRLSPGFR